MDSQPTYTFDWHRKEHAHVVRLLFQERCSSGAWRLAVWSLIGFLTFATVVTGALAILGDMDSALRLVLPLGLVWAMTLGFGRITGWIRTWQVQRQDPQVQHPLPHTSGESGLSVSTATVETNMKWAGIQKVRETPDLFMFYYSKRIAYYLPKRALAGPLVVDELRSLIKGRLPPSVPFEGS